MHKKAEKCTFFAKKYVFFWSFKKKAVTLRPILKMCDVGSPTRVENNCLIKHLIKK